MATKKRQELKAYFVKNAIPTQGNFADLIESQLNQADDGVFKASGEPLSVVAAPSDQRRVLRLYADYPSANADWFVSLKPAQDPADATTVRNGFGITDGAGNTRLFIDATSGRLGVGTNDPKERAHVYGGDLLVSGGKYRRVKVVSDSYWAGVELVARGTGEDAGHPHVDFTHGDLDAPNYGVRVWSNNNKKLTIEALEGDLTVKVEGKLSSASVDTGTITATGDITATGKKITSGSLETGTITATGDVSAAGKKITAGSLEIGAITATGDITATGKKITSGSISTGAITATGDITATGKKVTSASLEVETVTASGVITAKGGVVVDGNLGSHPTNDGAFYRHSDGQAYLSVDDNLYIRDTSHGSRAHFNTAEGWLRLMGNGPLLKLEGSDQGYIELYPKGLANKRKGWIGYGNSGTDTLTIYNDVGELQLAGTAVRVTKPLYANDGAKPFFIKKFSLNGANGETTGWRSDTYTAVVVGFLSKGGDINENGKQERPIYVFTYVKNGTWYVTADLASHGDHETWEIWVMRIHNDFIASESISPTWNP